MSAYKPTTEPRTGRPVLGDKTTNAKARLNHPTAAKTGLRPTTAGRPKPFAPKADSSKLHILTDLSDPLSIEVDTNPEPPGEEPYQSEVWPAGVVTFDAAKPANRLKGYYSWYHNRRDENGETRIDREMKARQEQRFRDADAKIRHEIDNMTFDLGLDDSPENPHKPLLAPQDPKKRVTRPVASAHKTAPSTLTSRRAASALSMAPPKAPASASSTQRKPFESKTLPSYMQPIRSRQQTPSSSTTMALASRPRIPSSSTAGLVASRSTLGYTKGRTARSALHGRSASSSDAAPPSASSRAFTRFETTASDSTITPESYAREAAAARPAFMSMFDAPLHEADADLFGASVEELFDDEEEEEDFQLTLEL